MPKNGIFQSFLIFAAIAGEMFIMNFNAPENKDLGIRMLSIMLRK